MATGITLNDVDEAIAHARRQWTRQARDRIAIVINMLEGVLDDLLPAPGGDDELPDGYFACNACQGVDECECDEDAMGKNKGTDAA